MRLNGDGDFGRRTLPDEGRGRSILDQAGSLPIEGPELRRHLKRAGVAFGDDTTAQVTKRGGFVNTDESSTSHLGGTVYLGLATGFTSVSYYTDGELHTLTAAASVAHGTTEGIHYIYLDGADLKTSTELTGDILANKTLVASLYYDATNTAVIQFSDLRRETNVAYRPPKLGVTTQYGAELDLIPENINGPGTSDDDARVRIDSYNAGDPDEGRFWEGDRLHLVVDNDAQHLNRNPAQVPVYYRDANGWRRQAQSDLHVTLGTSGRPNWNEFNGTAWVESQTSSGSYLFMHYIAVPNAEEPVICVMGIREYDSGSPGAEDAAFEIDALHLNGLTDLLPVWFMFGSVLWQVDSTYTNSVLARIISTTWGNYRDWRNYDQIGASLIEATRGGLLTNGDYTASTDGILAGRDTSGAGDLEEIAVGAGLSLSAATLTAEVTQAELDAVASDVSSNTSAIAGKQDQADMLDSWAGLSPSKFDMFYAGGATTVTAFATTSIGRSLLSAATAAALRAITGAQALDSDLTAIAALTTTSFGRSLLELAGAQAAQTAIGINDETAHVHFADFITADVDANGYQQSTSGSGAGSRQFWQFTTTTSNSQGVIELGTGTTASGFIGLHVGNNAIVTSTAAFKLGMRSQFHTLSTASDEYICHFGISNDVTSGGNGANEIGFRYDRATDGANWQCITRSSSTETKTDTGVAVTASTTGANPQVLEFTVNEAASSVTFTIDGVDAATHTTNIPNNDRMGYGVEMEATAYTSVEPVIGVDWIRFECTRSSAR
tara:strand:+ start:8854 stop:11187 length:2334 start_codon:yes stop_codon:yes gene_type:complete